MSSSVLSVARDKEDCSSTSVPIWQPPILDTFMLVLQSVLTTSIVSNRWSGTLTRELPTLFSSLIVLYFVARRARFLSLDELHRTLFDDGVRSTISS